MEFHLQNLGLLYRLALGEARATEIAPNWSADVGMVAHSAQLQLCPALAKLLATSGAQPRTFVPHHLKMPAASGTPCQMLSAMLMHDECASIQEQQPQQQWHMYSVGSGQRTQWLRAAVAAAQTLQLLSQTAVALKCSSLLPHKGRRC
jgi:hypothetical protein